MTTVTRRDLARALKEEYGGTITENDQWIQAFVEIVSREISEKGRVEIRGFGSFNLTTIKAHTTVNPGKPVKEGEEREVLEIPQTYAVDFRTSRIFKDRLKKEHAPKKKKRKRKGSKG